MLCFDDIKVELSCQGYKTTHIGISPDEKSSVLFFESQVKTKDVHCPFCGNEVYMHETYDTYLCDVPVWPGVMHRLQFYGHRYKCKKCGKTFTEDIPFVYPGTRITERAANQIKGFLKHKVSIRAIQEMTGIHWDTIRKIQTEYMKEKIAERKADLEASGYKPKFLAVDEFAIHKGHRYATCVMDLETGDVLWVGKGRTLSDFSKFFEEINPDTLSKVIAVAMDMNASYHKLVQKHIPQAEIVYDRYHMQAQYGKEVLGVVRLEEARKHSKISQEILSEISDETDKTTKKELQKQAKSEKQEYSKLKKSRWTLLMNRDNLSEARSQCLKEILQDHHDLAVCYAMKEEMCDLFRLTDRTVAEDRWTAWFHAAKSSGIPALVKFAELKEKRLPGLIAHAQFPISTGKLEGFNNKIKVAKRIGYGYRDDSFFFLLVRFISLPSSRRVLHTNP